MGGSTSKKSLIRILKAIVGVIVLIAVARHVALTWKEIQQRGGPPKVDWSWFLVAILAYFVGLVVYSWFFVRVMAQSPTPIRGIVGLRAYIVSHLGKYVPGKALVVVMRTGMAVTGGARASTAAFATFYETLVMMAVGGLVAAFTLLIGRSGPATVPLPKLGPIPSFDLPLGLLGLGMGLGLLMLVLPPVFPRLAAVARMPFRDLGADSLPRTSWKVLAEGVGLTALGWVALGLSQVAILRALSPVSIRPDLWPTIVGSVALATVAGFAVAVSPGGLGVREWVLWTALGSSIDKDLAVLAALGLRASWLIAEVVAGLCLIWIRPASVPALSPPCPDGTLSS